MGFPKRSHSTFVSVPKKPYNFTGGDLENLGAPAGEKKKDLQKKVKQRFQSHQGTLIQRWKKNTYHTPKHNATMEMLKLMKSIYLTSAAQSSHLTNKPEVDGALILPRPLSSSVLRFTAI